jgi:hypothetical protein
MYVRAMPAYAPCIAAHSGRRVVALPYPDLAIDPWADVPPSFDRPPQGRRGVWVVDVQGGGLQSRALLQRGSLAAVVRCSSAGQAFTLFREDGSVVTEPRYVRPCVRARVRAFVSVSCCFDWMELEPMCWESAESCWLANG